MTRRLGRGGGFQKKKCATNQACYTAFPFHFSQTHLHSLTWSRLLLPHGRITSSLRCQQLPWPPNALTLSTGSNSPPLVCVKFLPERYRINYVEPLFLGHMRRR